MENFREDVVQDYTRVSTTVRAIRWTGSNVQEMYDFLTGTSGGVFVAEGDHFHFKSIADMENCWSLILFDESFDPCTVGVGCFVVQKEWGSFVCYSGGGFLNSHVPLSGSGSECFRVRESSRVRELEDALSKTVTLLTSHTIVDVSEFKEVLNRHKI